MQEENQAIDEAANNRLLDKVIAHLNLKNDAALGRALEVAPPVISKLRHGKLSVAASIIVRIHEVTGLEIRQIKAEMNQRCLTQKVMLCE